MKILIVHTGRIADIVYSTALVRAIKVQLEAEVFLVTNENGALVHAENPYVDHLLLFSLRPSEIYKLAQVKFDHIIDLDSHKRSKLFVLLLKGKKLEYDRRGFEMFMLTKLKINKFGNDNLADRYYEVVKSLGIKSDEMRLDFFIPYKYEVPAEWLPTMFRKNYVVFCIGAPWKTRQLPLNRMIEMCDRINKPVILLGGFADIRNGDLIANFFNKNDSSSEYEEGLRELNKKALVYNACGKFNFQQEASIIKKASYVFTFDNDYLPVASAFGKETFCIYGNTVLSFGRYPYLTRFTVLEKNDLSCRPCSPAGYQKCPLGHFKCMGEISLDFYLS